MNKNKFTWSIVLFVACMGILTFSASAEDASPSSSSSSETQEINLSLLPGKVEEKCLHLKTGQIINYSFESSAQVHFNIHYHHEGVTYHRVWQKNTTAAKGRYQAELKRTFCAMWKNNSVEPVSLKYRVYVEN